MKKAILSVEDMQLIIEYVSMVPVQFGLAPKANEVNEAFKRVIVTEVTETEPVKETESKSKK